MLPLLKLADDGAEHALADAIDRLAAEFQLSDEERAELLPSGKQPRFNNRVGWASTYLRKAGLLQMVRRGAFQITPRGSHVLEDPPATIDLKFLEQRFSEVVEFRGSTEDDSAVFDANTGLWTLREAVESRIREKLERTIPDAETRLGALRLLAFAIENADEERSDSWYVRETRNGLRLLTGRLYACEIGRSTVKLSVIGPLSPDLLSGLGTDLDESSEFKSIPGGLMVTFPLEQAGRYLDQLKDSINSFIDLAMATVRRPSDLQDHVPEAVAYISKELG